MSLPTARAGHLPWASHRKEAHLCLRLWSKPKGEMGPGSGKTYNVYKTVSHE